MEEITNKIKAVKKMSKAVIDKCHYITFCKLIFYFQDVVIKICVSLMNNF